MIYIGCFIHHSCIYAIIKENIEIHIIIAGAVKFYSSSVQFMSIMSFGWIQYCMEFLY